MDMPCIFEKEEFKHKDTSTEQLISAVNLQSVSNGCRLNMPKNIQQWQQPSALFE